MSEAMEARQLEVAKRLHTIGRSMWAFNYPLLPPDAKRPSGEQYLSRTVEETMVEAERAFADAIGKSGSQSPARSEVEAYQLLDRAEHLAKLVEVMIRREAPIFAADPQKWIKEWNEVPGKRRGAYHARE